FSVLLVSLLPVHSNFLSYSIYPLHHALHSFPTRRSSDLPSQTPFLVVCCEDPYLLYSRLSQWFEKQRLAGLSRTIHPTAVIHESAHIGNNVAIGPHVVIEENVQIGDGATIGPACVIGRDCHIGADSLLHARVTF